MSTSDATSPFGSPASDGGSVKAPVGLVAFGDDGLVQAANDRVHHWLGYEPGALVGQPLDKLLTRSARVFYNTHFFPLLKLHGKADEIYLTLQTAEGEELPVLVSGLRDTTGATPSNHCALMTMWRRREFEAALLDAKKAAEAATHAKDEFLAVVSHELRTPLGAILGWTRLAQSGKLDATTQKQAFDTIERNVKTQARLIEDLLDISRIVSGKLRISPRALDLAPTLEAAIDTARPAAQAKEIQLVHAIDRDAGIVYADADRIQQIAWNLIANAIKFTPRGGRVQVAMARVRSLLRIEVADTGQGIAPAQLPYLFQRFWQAEPGVQRENSGLGLGLAICRSLVELHGGSIRADSPGLGQGTTVTVELPLAVSSAVAMPAPSDDADAAAGQSLDGIEVLVVDDHEDARSSLHVLLSMAGARVTAVSSAAEALDRLVASVPHILLCDIDMPGKDGLTLIREVRSKGTASAVRMAAIALTGLARPQERVKLLGAGYQAHLSKPAEPAELIALVRALAGHVERPVA
ncbi:MAG: ATP-binding protein [Casimicrobiaceae bacterium]